MVVYQQLRQDHRRRIEEADAAGFGEAVFIFRLIAYFEKLYLDNMVAADNGRRVEPHWPARPAHAEAAAGMGNARGRWSRRTARERIRTPSPNRGGSRVM